MSFLTGEKRVRAKDINTPRVAVIGAGAGGICMGAGLRRAGIKDFVIFEQSDGIGGTWHDNVYPGAAVDTAVPFYSFKFHPFDFSRTHVGQPELLRYLQNVADRFQLAEHLRLNTAVQHIEWDDVAHSYEVQTSDGKSERFDVVVSAVGLLNQPNYPTWPGLDDYKGHKFHSSRWDSSVGLTGKRVAVVGTGSTSAQVVPALAPDVSRLYLFQRQPGWVLPKDDRYFSAAERAKLARAIPRQWLRLKQGLTYERFGKIFVEGTKPNVQAQAAAETYIHEVFSERPDLAKAVTPNYPMGGKRIVRDTDFYPSLLRENVELVPYAVTHLTETGIVDETGLEREVDVIVMCTGFQPANFLATFDVVGRDGQSIHKAWNGEAEAYLGLTVAGFPNFYMLYGPNTNGAPILFMHERQTEFVVSNLKRMIRRGVTAIEVRRSVMARYNKAVQKGLSKTVVAKYPQVHNYGRADSGRNVIAWGRGMVLYSILVKVTARLSSVDRKRSVRMQAPTELRRHQ